MNFEFYLHNNYDASEIREMLSKEGFEGDKLEKAAEQLYSFFYEVGFNVEFDEKGNMKSAKFKHEF